jgi:hypothetical protein
MKRSRLGLAIGAFLFGTLMGAVHAEEGAASAPAARNDYSQDATWLCRPGRHDACAVDLSTTIVAANGKLSHEAFKANPKAQIDCFYVYPTVSFDTTPNSDMNPGPEEMSVIRAQFARFGSQCRTFAPLYRQVTLTALRANMSGKPMTVDRALGYNDVVDAWNYYLQHDNNGRGVVLIGHSQGSGVLTQLIHNEIDGKPVQSQLISAILMGTTLPVPAGKDVGGAFKSIPLCHDSKQLGCAIAYASFRANSPPPANSLFGRAQNGNVAACVNPAALGGGSGALHSYMSTGGAGVSAVAAKPWVTPEKKIETPFVSVPGLLTSECVSNEAGSYLAITVHGDPKDPRTDDISGDVVANGEVQKNWGLHLIDANLAMGNLVDIVHDEGAAYSAAHKSKK